MGEETITEQSVKASSKMLPRVAAAGVTGSYLSRGLVGRTAGALPVRGVEAGPVHVRMSHLMITE